MNRERASCCSCVTRFVIHRTRSLSCIWYVDVDFVGQQHRFRYIYQLRQSHGRKEYDIAEL